VAKHRVALFRQYPFAPGQKLHIADGPRCGDWEVVAADERVLKVRCPISGRELDWKPFCYAVEETEAEWPAED
jgi:hypothetical protein